LDFRQYQAFGALVRRAHLPIKGCSGREISLKPVHCAQKGKNGAGVEPPNPPTKSFRQAHDSNYVIDFEGGMSFGKNDTFHLIKLLW